MNNRRNFLMAGAGTLGSISILQNSFLFGQETDDDETVGVQNLPKSQVRDFVSNAHTNLKKTKELLEKEPRLLRANYEWAPGDFESAIGAAAHSGAVEIVKYLLDKGASYSIFVAAVLGHLDSVKATIKHNPGLINCRGAHGIPLLSHAVAGGKGAAEVADYLENEGAVAEEKWLDLAIDRPLADFALGTYAITRNEQTIKFSIVKEENVKLFIVVEGRPKKRLLFQGQTRFNIKGTPAELTFEREKEDQKHCQRVLLKEGFPVGFAKRQTDKN